MTSERAVTWQTKDGRTAMVVIKIEKSVTDKIVNADGDMVITGKQTINCMSLEMTVNGNFQTRDTNKPIILSSKAYAKHIAAGAYARLGDAYVSKQAYDEIMAAIASAEIEQVITAEVNEATKTPKAQYQQETPNQITVKSTSKGHGWCDKCKTYCYGDCTA